ncbi:hypothetical protein REH65_32985 [Saccharopolyspora sp. ID03-671]|uniref:hypothetical protein n=1 Tax=Saccharopolyspora sp. ID03-671 TaxID=3073066 RepID=UPI0032531601
MAISASLIFLGFSRFRPEFLVFLKGVRGLRASGDRDGSGHHGNRGGRERCLHRLFESV